GLARAARGRRARGQRGRAPTRRPWKAGPGQSVEDEDGFAGDVFVGDVFAGGVFAGAAAESLVDVVGALVEELVSEELAASFLAGVPPPFSDSIAFFRDADG